MARKKRKRRSAFYPIYALLTLLAVLAGAWGLTEYWAALSEYETSQCAYAAQAAAQPFLDGQFDALYERYGGEDAQYGASRMKQYAQGKALSCQSLFSANETERRYALLADGERVGEFTMRPDGARTKHGFETWTLADMTLMRFERARYEFRVTAPLGYAVVADGRTLGEAEATGEDERTESCQYVPEGAQGLIYRTYAFASESASPELSVTAEDGRACALETVSEGVYRAWALTDDALQAQMEPYAFELARAYAAYTTKMGSWNELMRYVEKGSPAAKALKAFELDWVHAPKSYKVTNERSGNYMRYGDTAFSCDVSYAYEGRYAEGERVYETSYTYYYALIDGKWMLHSFRVRGE